MKIEQIEVEKLIPYARNARLHSPEQVGQIAASIREFGFNNPVLVDKDSGIIAGHGRVQAAQKLGLADVPCIRLDHLTETQKRAYIIADNRLAETGGGWDEELLALEIEDLRIEGFDLDLTGFDTSALDEMFGTDAGTNGLTDPDDVPEAPAVPATKLGDVWLLGKHRLMCGDSTDAGSVALLMNGAKAQLMQTDPPYGIAYVKNAQSKGQAVDHVDIENDELDGAKLQEFLEAVIRAALPSLNEGCSFYLWHPMLTQGTFFAAAADILIHRQIIWCKPSLVFGRGDYHWQHELCFYGWIRGNRPPFYGERNQTTLWNIGRETSKEHPTAKPVDLWKPPIDNHTKPGETMYEPFSGSGSQIIAAEATGRRCYAMELDPKYVDVAVKRWQEFTGQTATLESTGEPFPCPD